MFPKVDRDVARAGVHTSVHLKLLVAFFSVAFIVVEIRRLFVPVVRSRYRVAPDNRRVFVNFNLTIDQDCSNIHVDVADCDGLGETNIQDGITKVRVPVTTAAKPDINIRNVSSGCHGFAANNTCCNTCWDLIQSCEASQALCFGFDKCEQCRTEEFVRQGHSQCMVAGHVKLSQAKGRFHFGIGENTDSNRRIAAHNISKVLSWASMSHTLHYFELGPSLPEFDPPMRDVIVALPSDSVWAVIYYIQAVPSTWARGRRRSESFQYTVAYSQRQLMSPADKWVPGIHFQYEFFPIHLTREVRVATATSAIVNICKVIGCLFSFAAAIDACAASIPCPAQAPRMHNDISKCL